MNKPLIHLQDLSFGYTPGRPVLQNLNFTLQPRQRLCLTGPNGAGKSTLLRLIMGLGRPWTGTVEILGKQRQHDADFKDVRRQVGLVFQDSDTQLFCPTVYDDVAFGPLNLGLPREAVEERVQTTLQSLGLTEYAQRITYQLSHGEKRLVALATILAMRPRLILLDEPTAGLDPQAESRLTEILLALPQEMLIVTHNQQFIQAIATTTQTLTNGHTQHPTPA